MKMNRRGFAPILIALIVAAGIAVFGGVLWYLHTPGRFTPITSTPPQTATSSPIIPSSTQPYFVASIVPTSGPVGTVITINGSGFAGTGNMVTLSGMTNASLKVLTSADGRTIKFTLPSTLGPNCKPNEACPQYLMLVTPGEHLNVSVITDAVTQDIGEFTVTGN